jgi:hypothetical protein
MKKCNNCLKEFEPKNPKGIFCCNSCRVIYFKKTKRAIEKVNLLCIELDKKNKPVFR